MFASCAVKRTPSFHTGTITANRAASVLKDIASCGGNSQWCALPPLKEEHSVQAMDRADSAPTAPEWPPSFFWRDIFLIFVLAAGVRLAFQLGTGFFVSPETWEEGEIALRIARGEGYTYELNGTTAQALRGPAYPLLLGALYVLLGSSSVVAGLLQAAMGGALAVVYYALAAAWSGRSAGRLVGMAVGLHPPLIVYASKIHQLNLDLLLVAAGTLLLIRARETSGSFAAIPLGVVAGLSLLSRPTLAPLFGALAFTPLRTTTARVGLAVMALLISVAVVTPWVARNYVVLGVPTLTTTSGYLLWIGNNPSATGSTLTSDGRSILEAAPEVRARVWGKPEVDQEQIFYELALLYIAEDPGRAAVAFLAKFKSFWWFGPSAGALYPPLWLTLYGVIYSTALLLAGCGLIWAWRQRDRWPLIVVIVVLLSVSVGQSVYYVEGRHRWAVEPLILTLAGLGVTNWKEGLGQSLRNRLRRQPKPARELRPPTG